MTSFRESFSAATPAWYACMTYRHTRDKPVQHESKRPEDAAGTQVAPPLTVLSVVDWSILSRMPLTDSSWLERLSTRFSTCLRLRSERRACEGRVGFVVGGLDV